jgi:hypothetical protein
MAIKVRTVAFSSPEHPRKSNLQIAISNWQQSLLFGLLWGAALALHSIGKLYLIGWQEPGSIWRLAILMFTGTSIGGMIGWLCSIWLSAHRISPKRFAASLVLILLFTVGTTALLFALQYRLYYSQWHMPTFSAGWFFQVLFTGLSALYLFAVQGLRLLLPFAPIGLIFAALIFSKIAPTNPK